jgi:hypothetical protein
MKQILMLTMLVSCGRINLNGGTTNKIETTGTTRHEIVLVIDPKLCEGQENVQECLTGLTTMLQQLLNTIKEVKDEENK